MSDVIVRNTRHEDAEQIFEMCRQVYPIAPPWNRAQIESHLSVFPEGQFVAVESDSGRVVGMASSLIIFWEDYDSDATWRNFTDNGYFTNHDPENGRTLYAAEVMVLPALQGQGIGKKLYVARRKLVQERRLLRIRAGARLRGYGRYVDKMSVAEYVLRVVRKELGDPTLSFQLGHGFQVIGLVSRYLQHDPESLGYAAIIEWLNQEVAGPEDSERQKTFLEQLKNANAAKGSLEWSRNR